MDALSKLARPLTRVFLAAVLAALAVLAGSAALSGSAAGATPLRRPGPPTSLRLVAEGDAIVATWSPPVWDGGSPITGYVGTCSIVTGPTSCVLGVTRKSGTPETFHVQAVNAVGKGAGATAKALASNETDCSYLGPYANLIRCDLAGRDLTGLNLSDSEMDYVNLERADLVGDNFLSADVSGANLENADLKDSNLSGDVAGANLDDADLTGARVDALLDGANLTDANLTQANMTGSELYVANHYQEARLRDTVWSDTTCPDGTNSDADGGTCRGHLGAGAP